MPLLSRIDYLRLVLGWLAVVGLGGIAFPSPLLHLVVVVAVIIFCAFGVVKMAESLADILGDPLGSLLLSLSIVVIEVILISAVMLGPAHSATIARDSVLAVSMIILALVMGLALLLGGIKFGGLKHNGIGASTYLIMIITLMVTAFGLPLVLGEFNKVQAVVVALLTMGLYGFFLYRQTGAQAEDFQEPHHIQKETVAKPRDVVLRVLILLLMAIPIVLLSHEMADSMNTVLTNLKAPAALAGLVIAIIVFLPETITSLRAAWGGEGQRLINLVHGALVSTLGLSIPSVLLIAVISGQEIMLAPTSGEVLFVGTATAINMLAFSSHKVTAIHGAALLMIFGAYLLGMFN
ncbi:calcium:proton antiporter [Corynebacterium callunae]